MIYLPIIPIVLYAVLLYIRGARQSLIYGFFLGACYVLAIFLLMFLLDKQKLYPTIHVNFWEYITGSDFFKIWLLMLGLFGADIAGSFRTQGWIFKSIGVFLLLLMILWAWFGVMMFLYFA